MPKKVTFKINIMSLIALEINEFQQSSKRRSNELYLNLNKTRYTIYYTTILNHIFIKYNFNHPFLKILPIFFQVNKINMENAILIFM